MSAIDGVSETFDPEAWDAGPRFRGPHRHHLPPGRGARHGADRLRPARGAQRVPAAHRRRALRGARPRPHVPDVGLRAAHRQRAVARRTAGGRSAPAATSASAARGYQYADGETADGPSTRPQLGRLHILEVQRLIRFMPKVVIGLVPRLGRRRRAQPARGLRPHPGQSPSTPGSSRPTPTSARFDGGFGSAYLARQVGQKFAREIFFLGDDLHRRGRAPDGHGQRGRPPRRPRGRRRWSGPARSTARARPRSGC